jgi:aspartyl-tRNA(Asn)/glutamyl-tRNA(Gln) amidotransferase subunit B
MSDAYNATIGLEIHAELKTNTKMFCNSKNDTNEKRPNVNICPVCMGHPGTLPAINKAAVKHILKMGLAVGGTIADFTEFDRKNYFYPDIPKGYQISQYKFPLVSGGELSNIKITRVHLEEDTAKSTHDEGEDSLVDFNRAGIPLMELVTEPVIHSAEDAVRFAKELQLLLRYLGAGDANMERGEMRVEANISVSKTEKFGTKTEVKNLNSFKVVEKAIRYEIKRQTAILEKGEKVVQETRGWDDVKGETYSQRIKEDSHDYRYFPDPDLPKLMISEIPEFNTQVLQKELPELPQMKRERLKMQFELKDEDAEIYVQDIPCGKFFENTATHLNNDKKLVKLASNYISSDLIGLIKSDKDAAWSFENIETRISTKNFSKLIAMVGGNKLSSRAAKDILAMMHKEGGDPETIAHEKNLLQKNDEGEIKKLVEKIIADNPTVAADYKSGKQAALQFLIGQAMKATRGSANPDLIKTALLSQLS